jgi:hypothetical protein
VEAAVEFATPARFTLCVQSAGASAVGEERKESNFAIHACFVRHRTAIA